MPGFSTQQQTQVVKPTNEDERKKVVVQQIQDLEAQEKDMKAGLKEYDSLQKDLVRVDGEVKDAQDALMAYLEDLKTAQDALQATKGKCLDQSTIELQLRASNAALQEANTTMTGENEKLDEKVRVSRAELDSLEKEKKIVQIDIKTAEDTLDKLEDQKENNGKVMAQLEEKKAVLEDDIERKIVQSDLLQSGNASLLKEKDRLEQDILLLEAEKTALETGNTEAHLDLIEQEKALEAKYKKKNEDLEVREGDLSRKQGWLDEREQAVQQMRANIESNLSKPIKV